MSLTLGIDVGDELVTAALVRSEDLGAITVLELGDNRAPMAAAVGAAADQTVLVGDAAASAGGTVITDPVQRAGSGRRGALAELLAFVLRRAARAGAEPLRLGVVVPDDFDAVQRSQVVAAANAAGMKVVTTVPRSAAHARGSALPGIDELAEAACGAAAIAAVDAERIITREELRGAPDALSQPEDKPPPARTPPAASWPEQPRSATVVASSAGASVFGHGDHGVAKPKPQRSADATITRPARDAERPEPPADAPAGVASSPEPAQPFASATTIAVAAAIVIGILGVIAVLAFGGGGGGSQTATTGDVVGAADEAGNGSVSSTPDAAAVPASDDEAAVPAASLVPDSSSAASSAPAPTSSSITSSSSTTSSAPPGPVVAGAVVLIDGGLQLSNEAFSAFGTQSWELLEALDAVLGEPDYDSGLIVVSDCLGSRSRFVRYGSLELVFTETAEAPGIATFTQWHLSAADELERFAAPGGLAPGVSVGSLQYTYGEDLSLVAAFEDDPLGVFSIDNPAAGTAIYGLTDSTDPEGAVTSLWAGDSCTRLYT